MAVTRTVADFSVMATADIILADVMTRAVVWAFGVAASRASGSLLLVRKGAWNKPCQAGEAAMKGPITATAARKGLLGEAEALQGRYGLLKGYSDGEPIDRATAGLLDGLACADHDPLGQPAAPSLATRVAVWQHPSPESLRHPFGATLESNGGGQNDPYADFRPLGRTRQLSRSHSHRARISCIDGPHRKRGSQGPAGHHGRTAWRAAGKASGVIHPDPRRS